MVKGKLLVLFASLVVFACGVTNMSPPEIKVNKEEKEEYNSIGGVKNITDWFALMPSFLDFDLDNNGSIDQLEYYSYIKNVRTQFQWHSPWCKEADENKNGYVVDVEWDRQVARVRSNGDWVKVFDADRDGKMSIDEELAAVKHIKGIKDYYSSVVTSTAMGWTRTVDVELIQSKYDADGSYSVDNEEVQKYINDHSKIFRFYFDWNDDGEINEIEAATANDVIQRTFDEINEYLMQLKAQKYSTFI